MPYKIRKKGKGYKVCKVSGKCFSKKPIPYKRAVAQMRAIQANETNTFTQAVLQILSEENC